MNIFVQTQLKHVSRVLLAVIISLADSKKLAKIEIEQFLLLRDDSIFMALKGRSMQVDSKTSTLYLVVHFRPRKSFKYSELQHVD